jgi:hypothetical protein
MRYLAAALTGVVTFAAVFVVGLFAAGLLAAVLEVSLVVAIFVTSVLAGWAVFKAVSRRDLNDDTESDRLVTQGSSDTQPLR